LAGLSTVGHVRMRMYWLAAGVLLAAGLAALGAAVPAKPVRALSVAGFDLYPAWTDVTRCAEPLAGKPGVKEFRDMILSQVGGGDDGLAVCKQIANDSGAYSDHADGRAWDWHVEADNPADRAIVARVFDWLLRADEQGHRNAMARRIGLVYIIWNHQYYRVGSDNAHWVPYTSTGDPHDTHVHFSFSVAGANRQTSWWTQRGPLAMTLPGHQRVVFGSAGNVQSPVAGDWDGDGRDTIGTYNPASRQFSLSGLADGTPPVGPFGAIPVVGDWDGTGHDGVGAYDPMTHQFSFASALGTEVRPPQTFGEPGDLPIIGDWNGDRTDDVGTYSPAHRTFKRLLPDGSVRTEVFGNANDIPVIGDWDGNGTDEIGVYRPSSHTFVLATRDGPVLSRVTGAGSRQQPVVGDFDGNGTDEVATVTAH
jgi:hypothetical protein